MITWCYYSPVGFLKKFFGKNEPVAKAEGGEQLARLHIPLSDGQLGTKAERDRCFDLEEKIAEAVSLAGVGEHDGNEVGGGEFTIWCYGMDAKAIVPILRDHVLAANLHHGAWIHLRLGDVEDEDAPEERIDL